MVPFEVSISSREEVPMPGPILHMGSTIMCPHGGKGIPVAAKKVLCDGKPVALLQPMMVSGCAFGGSGKSEFDVKTGAQHLLVSGLPPCSQILPAGGTRVLVEGQPVASAWSVLICLPTGGTAVVADPASKVIVG